MQVRVEEQLSGLERTAQPLWSTFCGVSNGAWQASLAAFNPATGGSLLLVVHLAHATSVACVSCPWRLEQCCGTLAYVTALARCSTNQFPDTGPTSLNRLPSRHGTRVLLISVSWDIGNSSTVTEQQRKKHGPLVVNLVPVRCGPDVIHLLDRNVMMEIGHKAGRQRSSKLSVWRFQCLSHATPTCIHIAEAY